MNIIKNEPVLISGFIATVLALFLAFGVNLSTDQIGAIMAVVTAGLAIVARTFVTPVNKLTTPPTPEDLAESGM